MADSRKNSATTLESDDVGFYLDDSSNVEVRLLLSILRCPKIAEIWIFTQGEISHEYSYKEEAKLQSELLQSRSDNGE